MKRKRPPQKTTDRSHERHRQRSQEVRCTCSVEDVLPRWFPWLVAIATMAVKVYYVCLPESLWILHPDEVFQSVEVAFTDVFGYGFYPYEYTSQPTNPTTPADIQLAKMGMYSLRSFLYPLAFSVAMEVARWTNIGLSPVMVCRIFNALVTSSLPLAVYKFVNNLCQCHIISCMACALTAFSVQLTVFGTHCIINSFSAPFLFLGLSLCLPRKEEERISHQNNNLSGMNGNIFRNRQGPRTASNGVLSNGIHNCCNDRSNDNGIRNNGLCLSKPDLKRVYRTFSNHYRELIGGVLLGTVFYIRPDTVLNVGVIYTTILCFDTILFGYDSLQNLRCGLFSTVLGMIIGPCFGILYDSIRYKSLVIPPLNWLKFNLVTNNSLLLFGKNDSSVYFKLLLYDTFHELLFIFIVLVYSYAFLFWKRISLNLRDILSMVTSLITLFIIYLSIGHKEGRFLHNVIVIYIVVISYGFHILIEIANQICQNKSLILSGIIIFLSGYGLHTLYNFPSATVAMARNMTYKNAIESNDINICLKFISNQKDVRGVMLDASIFESHSFSILQHDVPLLTKIHHEYRLYEADDTRMNRIRVLNKYVDFIDEQNIEYLLRLLGISDTFNYIVTKRFNLFKVLEYQHVFKSGSYAVLTRYLSDTQEQTLNKMAKALPLGINATILEYEANWLITSGLYEKAIARAKRCLELDQSRVRVFQQLMVAYAKMEMWSEVVKYETLCLSVHGGEKCKTQQDKVVLHDTYRQFENT